MSGELTVSERIMFHLNSYVKFEDKFEVPFDMTQDGISQACAISRAHAAIELKKLKGAGLVEERLTHIRKGKSRRKAYFLTAAGKGKASDVVQYVKENDIRTHVDPSRVRPELSSGRLWTARRSSPLPALRYFYGRKEELKAVAAALERPSVRTIAVRGIAGIGKTTLLAKVASEMEDHRVFWYSTKPWDGSRALSDSLGRFFADNGVRKIASYLASGKFDLGDLSYLFDEELSENGYAFVFDDADLSESVREFLRMLRHSCGSSKILISCESDPGFYESSDIIARTEVVEVELGGLDKSASLQLLREKGIEGSVAEELVKVTRGHALSLEMVTASTATEAKYQVSRFLEEKFYAGLGDLEKSLLQLSSVFQKPFTSDAIPRELRQSRKGSMLREAAPGRFEIHSSLKEFVYDSMTKEERSRWHSAAADYYLRAGDKQERLFHLIRAGRTLEAEILVSKWGEELLAEGNIQRIWEILSDFEPTKPKYRPAVLLLKAKAASIVGAYDASWKLLEMIRSEEAPLLRAEALVEMGKILSKKGDLEGASVLFSRALESAGDSPVERAKALRGLGVVQGKLGDYAKARDLLDESARSAMTAMDSRGMLMAQMELGNILIYRGMYEEAIDHFSKCAAGFGPVELTNVHINLGVANDCLGNRVEARRHLENAVKLAEETGQPRPRAYALTSLAEVLINCGEVEAAKEHCFTALNILTELNDRLGTSAAYANLGLAERVSGNMDSGEGYYRESLKALEGVDIPRSLGIRKYEFALLLEEKGDVERAAELLRESQRLFENVGAKDMFTKAEHELIKLGKG
jgi:tetratricopeptide (TPR) repeat protein